MDWLPGVENWQQWLTRPFEYPFDPASRMFWLFWVSAGVLTLVALALDPRPWRQLLAGIFSRRHWLSRSTAVDLGFLFGNSALRAALVVPLLGSHLMATLVVARFLQGEFGNAPELGWPLAVVAGLYTLCFFVVEDASRFGLHYAMHKVPLLWRLHRVHHSARRMTPLTLFRLHPAEMVLYYGRGLVVFGLVSGVFVYLFGRQLDGWSVLGVDALGFAFNFLGANLRHSHIWLSFGPAERWFISPAAHQIHHSVHPAHRDTNLGTCLSLWDRLAGTHRPASTRRQRLAFGLAR